MKRTTILKTMRNQRMRKIPFKSENSEYIKLCF